MSDSSAPGELAAKLIDAGVVPSQHADHPIDIANSRSGSLTRSRIGDTGLRRRMTTRLALIAAVLPALFVCTAAMAQVTAR